LRLCFFCLRFCISGCFGWFGCFLSLFALVVCSLSFLFSVILSSNIFFEMRA
jgi:hypothetical protein